VKKYEKLFPKNEVRILCPYSFDVSFARGRMWATGHYFEMVITKSI